MHQLFKFWIMKLEEVDKIKIRAERRKTVGGTAYQNGKEFTYRFKINGSKFILGIRHVIEFLSCEGFN